MKATIYYGPKDIRLEELAKPVPSPNHVSKLVTHEFSIDKVVEAFETAADPATGAIKVVINYEL